MKTDDEQISQQIYKKIMETIINQPGYDKGQDFALPNDINKFGNMITWKDNNRPQGNAIDFLNPDNINQAKDSVKPDQNISTFFTN